MFAITTNSKFDVGLFLAKTVVTKNKKFMINLSSANLLKRVWTIARALIPYCTVVFGNENELRSVAEIENWDTEDLQECQVRLAKMMHPDGLVIITRGKNPTFTAKANYEIKVFQVPLIPKEEIVDSNGCGDAFVGGFLSHYDCPGSSLEDCINAGHKMAGIVIRQTGFILPKSNNNVQYL